MLTQISMIFLAVGVISALAMTRWHSKDISKLQGDLDQEQKKSRSYREITTNLVQILANHEAFRDLEPEVSAELGRIARHLQAELMVDDVGDSPKGTLWDRLRDNAGS